MTSGVPVDAELPAAEQQLLSLLADHRARTTAELVDQAGLLPEALRAILCELCRRGIVLRGVTGPTVGRWRLAFQETRRV